MSTRLTNIEIDEVSLCKKGANQAAKVALLKSIDEDSDLMSEKEIKVEVEVDVEKAQEQIASLTEEVEKLQKAFEDMTAERDELNKQMEDPKEDENSLEKKMEDMDPELKKVLDEAKESAELAKKEAENTASELRKMQRETLNKQIVEKISEYKSVEDADEFAKTLIDFTSEQREHIYKVLDKNSGLIKSAAEITMREAGITGASVGDAASEVQKRADELRKTNSEMTEAAARDNVRKSDPELTRRERDEADANKR